MRHISFKDAEQYKYTYIACVANPRYELGPADRRVHGRLMDAIESIGKPEDNGLYVLGESGITGFILEEAEFGLLKKLISNFPWPPIDSRKAVALEDWLDSIKEESPKPKPVDAS